MLESVSKDNQLTSTATAISASDNTRVGAKVLMKKDRVLGGRGGEGRGVKARRAKHKDEM